MDFTLSIYKELVNALMNQGFSFSGVSDYKGNASGKLVLLRHDVDKIPINSLELARIQEGLGIKGSFYFRVVPESFNEDIIAKIASLGHEIGYHYEDFELTIKRLRATGHRRRAMGISKEELAELALESFSKNLGRIRQIAPVQSICMHGSPLCRWDNRLLWKYYDYKEFGIEIEPYFDIDFTKMLYLTETGRRWDGSSVSVRDKGVVSSGQLVVNSNQGDFFKGWKVKPIKGSLMRMTTEGIEFQNRHKYTSTGDIKSALKAGSFPERAMMTFHPQRWTDKTLSWIKELVGQKVKNGVKYFILKVNSEQ